MRRGSAIAVLLFAALTLAAVAPASAQALPCATGSTCDKYARAQIDSRIAQLNVTSNILRVLLANLTDNSRSLAYMSVNSTITSRYGSAVWEQVTSALSNSTLCQFCTQNASAGLGYYANNSSALYGDFAGTKGRAALARMQLNYLQTNVTRAGDYASIFTAVLRDAVIFYTETQKQIYSALGI